MLAVPTFETGPFARCGPHQHTPEHALGDTPPPLETCGDPAPATTHGAP
ncbi:MAG: hypothetical protein ACRDQ4_23380 [Pseudonocardiaceae bacterium]